jgi:caffeoyl-CoA O-methyltransferase
MAPHRPNALDADLLSYLADHCAPRPDEVQKRLIDATQERTGKAAVMQIGIEQGVLFDMLTRALRATRALEIGTFTGYSALAIARGLAPGGRLVCCDVNDTWTTLAQEHWSLAGVADRIDLRLGPALDTLASMTDDERFDLVFIDADKPNYPSYLAAVLPRLEAHGIILVDNTLWSRRVLDPDIEDADTLVMRQFNDAVTADPHLRSVILPIGDGVTMIQWR